MIAVAEIQYGEYLTFISADLQAQVIFGVLRGGIRFVNHPGFQYLQGASNDLAHGLSTPMDMMCDSSGGMTRKIPLPESFTMVTDNWYPLDSGTVYSGYVSANSI